MSVGSCRSSGPWPAPACSSFGPSTSGSSASPRASPSKTWKFSCFLDRICVRLQGAAALPHASSMLGRRLPGAGTACTSPRRRRRGQSRRVSRRHRSRRNRTTPLRSLDCPHRERRGARFPPLGPASPLTPLPTPPQECAPTPWARSLRAPLARESRPIQGSPRFPSAPSSATNSRRAVAYPRGSWRLPAAPAESSSDTLG